MLLPSTPCIGWKSIWYHCAFKNKRVCKALRRALIWVLPNGPANSQGETCINCKICGTQAFNGIKLIL